MTVLILAGLWVLFLVVLVVLIVRGVWDLCALKDERRAVAVRQAEQPHKRARARAVGRSGSKEN